MTRLYPELVEQARDMADRTGWGVERCMVTLQRGREVGAYVVAVTADMVDDLAPALREALNACRDAEQAVRDLAASLDD